MWIRLTGDFNTLEAETISQVQSFGSANYFDLYLPTIQTCYLLQ